VLVKLVRGGEITFEQADPALALERRCGLVTADERFFRAMRSEFLAVQLVRNYVPSDQLPR